MLNMVVLQGRLTADPELRRTSTGKAVASFGIACNRDYSEPDGTKATDFVDGVCWGKTAETFCQYFHKGGMVLAAGSLRTRTYQDKNGNNRKATEFLMERFWFCEKKQETAGAYQQPSQYQPPANSYTPYPAYGTTVNAGDDDSFPIDSLPF